MLVFLWLYYSKFYILGSIAVTYMLNKTTDKLYYPPLIINMVSVLMLFILNKEARMYAIYFNYLPIVITSIFMNFVVYIYRRIKYR
ncbi:hypothetical protein [Oceanivirga salmonicida]|uniref:hypothetical protein n=1 Tax=Oceanivirga salmonicida TaxID=1769291 RepID=UPI0008344898|nr:hypothetical protein [Oceanivirga salmonicida]